MMTSGPRDVLIRARQQNLDRFCRLLTTNLSKDERDYFGRRIAEERREIERLMGNGTSVARSVRKLRV
jgi:hypothetical protein